MWKASAHTDKALREIDAALRHALEKPEPSHEELLDTRAGRVR